MAEQRLTFAKQPSDMGEQFALFGPEDGVHQRFELTVVEIAVVGGLEVCPTFTELSLNDAGDARPERMQPG